MIRIMNVKVTKAPDCVIEIVQILLLHTSFRNSHVGGKT